METEAQRAERLNRELRAEMAASGGLLRVYLGGKKVHAATSITRGHSGYDHPRARCQNNTPRTYGHAWPSNDTREITCQRCLASLEARP